MSSPDKVLRKKIAICHIVRDMQFLSRVAYDIVANQNNRVIVSLATNALTSFMVYESARFIRGSAPEYLDLANVVLSEELTASRHSVKLFDGDEAGYVGVSALFEDGFLQADREAFIESIGFAPLRAFGVDLGLTFLGGKLIYTTNALQFNLGLGPGAAYQKDSGQRLMEMARQCSQFATSIGSATGITGPGGSFVGRFDDSMFCARDTVASTFYVDLADPALADGLSASLAAICGMLNTLTLMIGLDTSIDNGPTVTKLHFVVLWHGVRALAEIQAKFGEFLSPASKAALNQALNLGSAAVVLTDGDNRLRNALVHYGLNRHYPVAQLDPSRPLFGLVETVYPSLDYFEFQKIVYDATSRLAEVLNQWLQISPTIGRAAPRS
ncbi:hypothetical protein [Pseudonocardia humida]|uniref:Uncharacterized protein n=1 Tax=Pseudonocardia humida TaxID=2800819 RepID=A0ABT1A8X2_9PSEU|nr:hypothetical protein [Pseudonocardia humida]MCO1659391.1 hypothetical protein [Pseudonocardia humida]